MYLHHCIATICYILNDRSQRWPNPAKQFRSRGCPASPEADSPGGAWWGHFILTSQGSPLPDTAACNVRKTPPIFVIKSEPSQPTYPVLAILIAGSCSRVSRAVHSHGVSLSVSLYWATRSHAHSSSLGQAIRSTDVRLFMVICFQFGADVGQPYSPRDYQLKKTNRLQDDKWRGSEYFLRPHWVPSKCLTYNTRIVTQRQFALWFSQTLKWSLQGAPRNKSCPCLSGLGSRNSGSLVTSTRGSRGLSLPRPTKLSCHCSWLSDYSFPTCWKRIALVQSFLGSRKGRGGLVQDFHREASRNPFSTVSWMF